MKKNICMPSNISPIYDLAKPKTLSVVVWSLWSSGQHGPSAAMSLIMILLMLPVMILYWRIGNRVGGSLSGTSDSH